MTDVILAVIILVPLVMTFFLRSSAAAAFAAACIGFTLVTLVGSDLKNLASEFNVDVTASLISMILLFGPALLTLILSRHYFSSPGQFLIQAVPALCMGAFLAIAAVPYIADTAQLDFGDSKLLEITQRYQSIIIGVGAILSLLLIWSTRSHGHGKHKRHK